MINENALNGWIVTELQASRRDPKRQAQLKRLAEKAKAAAQHLHADALPVGSYQRQLAMVHQRKLASEALQLGYQIPDEDLQELGLHVAGHALGLGLSL
ncbi:hypothetical protein HF673_00095 [Acidithiobacillus thiooxidans]|uniref:hypothetical protein n=1 Tax=Acidithiobacillus thiooxidans TaxID=930 RepID=UPI001C06AA04|nr:hypothetical protein [Acidithiobacillus thiooxidans]MBU2834217.1 hypothetical protein [Acidithiobacillus thiooxidans]